MDKNNCWYKDICAYYTNNACMREDFCLRFYKMQTLVKFAKLEGNQCFSIQLYPEKIDYKSFLVLKDIQNNITDFVVSGKNLFIYSKNTGNGKTEWAKKILLSYFNSIWLSTDLVCRGLFISVPQLLISLKNNVSEEDKYFRYIDENIINADIVVWDDFLHKAYTQFEYNYIFNIISSRNSIGKSNIYTCTESFDRLNVKMPKKLYSLTVNNSELVELFGSDKRNIKG